MSDKKITLDDALGLIHGSNPAQNEVAEAVVVAAPVIVDEVQPAPSIVDGESVVESALEKMKRSAKVHTQDSAAAHLKTQMQVLRPHVEKVLLTAHEQAGQMLAHQHAQADLVLAQARQKASDIIREAHLEAEQIMSKKLERMAENIETIYAHADDIASASDDPRKAYKLIDAFVNQMVSVSEEAVKRGND